MIELNKIYNMDCLEVMKQIDDKSVDLILCDLPYGTTACKWDTIIPFEPLWKEYKRIIKDNGAIVLTASQPFTSALVMSNLDMFKYELIWEKEKATNFMLLSKQFGRVHENILIFYKKQPKYNPIMIPANPDKIDKRKRFNDVIKKDGVIPEIKLYRPKDDGLRYPTSILYFNRDENSLHPTQKPVALFEYLIKTYTNEGDLVLDNCIGSGTTAVACEKLGRKWIGIEREQEYVDIANKRLEKYINQTRLFKEE
ncbi:MAG TPA: site-specific DNA-methyltransferase [Caldisericia bacterium]|nr:site-specific DNA-methyltransferase [Caldisericia bacterium]